MGNKSWEQILRLGTTKFSKKYGKQNMGKRLGHKTFSCWTSGNDVEMTWKWRGNDVEMTWSRPLIHWSTDPLIHWSTDEEMTWKWRGLDHWSTDLQSCKCSWGEIWEIWGTILVQMALIFWQGALHFYIWGVQRTTRFKKSWRQNRNTFTDTFTYKSLDKYSDKYVDKSFYQHLFRNMYLEICI